MSAKTNLTLDIAIFTVFLAVANPHLTGNTIHEWLSLAFGAAIITHLLFHWDWMVQVTKDYFKKVFHQSRLNYIVDLLFFIAMTGCMFSGLLISKDVLPSLGIQLGEIGRSWKMIHTSTADASVILLGIHFSLHWRWVISNLKRYIVSPVMNRFKAPVVGSNLSTQPIRIEDGK